MERNRWATALRCLEVALHPNTGDDEIVAAINGFRRTVQDTPLAEVLSLGAALDVIEPEQFERLKKFNRALRRQLEVKAADNRALASDLQEIEQRCTELSEQLAGAEKEISDARRGLADYRTAIEALKDENNRLREQLDALQPIAPSPSQSPSSRFTEVLATARSSDTPSFATERVRRDGATETRTVPRR